MTASATIRNPQTFNRYNYALNSPYKFTDPLGLAAGFCSAEFINCDGETERRPYGEAEHDQRVRNTYYVNNANQALQRGDQASAEAICARNPEISCTKATTTVTSVNIVDDPPNAGMTISWFGLGLLLSYEGAVDGSGNPVLNYYSNDGSASGNCTVGWGHLANSGPCGSGLKGKTITPEEAVFFLITDLAKHQDNVISKVKVKLSQQQFDALVILDFNYGLGARSTPKLLNIINTLNVNMMPVQRSLTRQWSNIGGAPGLAARRADELEVFFHGLYERGAGK